MNFRSTVFFLLTALIIVSCTKNQKSDGEVLAKVYDNYLYKHDVKSIMPVDVNPKDSAEIIKTKVDMWLRKQLLLNQANANLSEEQKNVEQIVADYRASLLIDKYKQEFLKQKLDTTVELSEIKEYYNVYAESFILSRNIIKGYFLKVPLDHENFNNIWALCLKADKESIAEMTSMGDAGFQIIDFTNEWNSFSEYSDQMPSPLTNVKRKLAEKKDFSARNKTFLYFIKVLDVRTIGQAMPFEKAKEEIKLLLINKQKTELLNTLESTIYRNAIKNGDLEIYIDNEN